MDDEDRIELEGRQRRIDEEKDAWEFIQCCLSYSAYRILLAPLEIRKEEIQLHEPEDILAHLKWNLVLSNPGQCSWLFSCSDEESSLRIAAYSLWTKLRKLRPDLKRLAHGFRNSNPLNRMNGRANLRFEARI